MGKKILTIGYITPRLLYDLHLQFYLGVLEGTREYNANFLCFSGPSHRELYELEKEANIIFDLITPSNIDGIVCWTSGLYRDDGYLFDMEGLLKRNYNIPFVCIGKPLKNNPTLQADDYQCVSQLMTHLIEHHKYKKIAFIKGPKYHLLANTRYAAYLDLLKKYNIPFNKKLVSNHGDFEEANGIKGIQYFFDELKLKPKKDIEAIITVSDLITVGAVKEMQRRGIKIPEHVAVGSINNREEGLEITPQLTSVDLQFSEIGKRAVKTVISMINKEKVPELIYTPTKLVIRESCGCSNTDFISGKKIILQNFNNNEKDTKSLKASIERNKEKITEKIIFDLENLKKIKLDKKQILTLFNKFIEDIFSNTENNFIQEFKKILEEELKNKRNLSIWQNVISKMRTFILPLINSKDLFFKSENLFHNAEISLLQKIDQSIAINKLEAYRQGDVFPVITSAIVTTFDVKTLMSIIEKELPRLGISACYLSIYVDPKKSLDKAKIIMAYNETGHIDLTKYNRVFPSYQLGPKGFFTKEKRYEFVVQPLFFKDNPIGFILFKVGPVDSNMYFTLRSYISSALQGAFLVKHIEERAKELEQAYKNLKENQQKLIISEKMASLGRLTAGIAHEMNTPLAAVRSALKEIGALIDEYKASIDNKNVLPEDHKAISIDMQKNLDIALQSIEKSVGFIRGIKSQTYNLLTNNMQIFNASNIIFDNLNLLEYIFKKSNCHLIKNIDQGINLYGDPQSLSQIVTNLTINAVDACKENSGTVTVYFKKHGNDKVILIVKDTGAGIGKKDIVRIFDPFFTTKSFGEGTGLGLSIVHELVNEYNGNIDVKSKPGDTIFTVTFPIKKFK